MAVASLLPNAPRQPHNVLGHKHSAATVTTLGIVGVGATVAGVAASATGHNLGTLAPNAQLVIKVSPGSYVELIAVDNATPLAGTAENLLYVPSKDGTTPATRVLATTDAMLWKASESAVLRIRLLPEQEYIVVASFSTGAKTHRIWARVLQ